ncbi:hypothetical protein AVEN_85216-1 [Araneus ventricosus]|uniref:Uncharacterized protein n=1 Tax=Araneus ventricosus TaxID=182803 RepID=A0A4Y2EC14_ARAVE|nr:hypothetical protein AVEN_85216-1 [Araneus ventricosus]
MDNDSPLSLLFPFLRMDVFLTSDCLLVMRYCWVRVDSYCDQDCSCVKSKGFKPDSSESDAESGRSAELIQNGRSKPGAIPPDALYTATKRDSNSSSDNRPLYENLKPDKNDNRNEASLVYASLDLPNPVPQTRNGHNKPKHNPPPRRDRTEYAEIQFQPKVYEQASL